MPQENHGPNTARAAEAKSLVFDAIQAAKEGNKEEFCVLAEGARDLDEMTAYTVLKQAGLEKN